MPLESEFGAAGVIDVLSVVDVCGGDEASTKKHASLLPAVEISFSFRPLKPVCMGDI